MAVQVSLAGPHACHGSSDKQSEVRHCDLLISCPTEPEYGGTIVTFTPGVLYGVQRERVWQLVAFACDDHDESRTGYHPLASEGLFAVSTLTTGEGNNGRNHELRCYIRWSAALTL